MSQWQTVKSNKPDVKKKRSSEQTVAPARRIETTESVFSALDNWYDNQQEQRSAHQTPAEDSNTHQLNGRGPASVTSDESSSSSAPQSVGQKARHEPIKAKKPKAKRPKITPSQAASGLDSTKFADLLASVQQTYPDNQLSQLQTVGDHLLTAFQTSELPFNKLLNEQPVEKVSSKITNINLTELHTIHIPDLYGTLCCRSQMCHCKICLRMSSTYWKSMQPNWMSTSCRDLSRTFWRLCWRQSH